MLFIEWIKKQQYQSSPLGIFVNPYFINRWRLFKVIKKYSCKLSGIMLDFGCANKPYENLFPVKQHIGIDIKEIDHTVEERKNDVLFDGNNIPFLDRSFDCILATEVLEHIINLDDVLNEFSRILRPGGIILVSAPFVWNEHSIPYDFRRFTSYGIKRLFEKHGFCVKSYEKTTNYIETIAQMTTVYIFKTFFGNSTKPLKLIVTILLLAPIHLIGILAGIILPKNNQLFVTNVILAQKVTTAD